MEGHWAAAPTFLVHDLRQGVGNARFSLVKKRKSATSLACLINNRALKAEWSWPVRLL